jgi:hypothetical protein
MSRKEEQKKQRRKKRLAKKQRHPNLAESCEALSEMINLVDRVIRAQPPGNWPGGCDSSLARPDLVKFKMTQFVKDDRIGRSKLRNFENRVQQGPLGDVPSIDHWAMEEFFWHGPPRDAWHPIDEYLNHHNHIYSIEAANQIRRWKEARLGVFEIGPVKDDTILLREWCVVTGMATGQWFRSISLSIGGVNDLNDLAGSLLLTYVAPWAPDQDLSCAMGYSQAAKKKEAAGFAYMLGLRNPDQAARTFPWEESPSRKTEFQLLWGNREWYGWLAAYLRFPFYAVTAIPKMGRFEIIQVTGMARSTAAEASQWGIYLSFQCQGDNAATGATAVMPLDITSGNSNALNEYRAYRKWAGPPPGTLRTR